MSMDFRVLVAALAALPLTTAPAQAHHSAARFDTNKHMTISGVVTRYEWANPHVYIFIKQLTDAGDTVDWELEGQPPTLMKRLGWSPETLHVGDKISATGSPAKNEQVKSLLVGTLQKDDRNIFDMMGSIGKLASDPSSPRVPAKSLDGVWVTLLAYKLILPLVDPAHHLSLTDAGTRAVTSYDEKTMSPAINCVPYPSPAFMLDPDVKRISMEGGIIRIGGEFDGAERIIHMDETSHDGAKPSVQGHSIGHWDGDTLVIDTAAFSPHRIGNAAAGLPSGPKKHLVERLTFTPDRTALTYSFELTDPDYLAEPMTGEVTWDYRPDMTFEPLKCDPAVARRFSQEE